MRKNLKYFEKVIKSVKKLSFDDLVYNLKTALSKAQKEADKQFLMSCLACLDAKKMSGIFTEEDKVLLENQIKQTLGVTMETLSQQPFIQAMIQAYGQGKRKTLKPAKLDYSLGDKDLGALQSLRDFNCWWVRGKVEESTNSIIQEEAERAFKGGCTRATFATRLEEALSKDVKESGKYFDLLADHVLTKTQNMGHVSGYEEAGVEYVRIVAVIDEKTSPICRRMNHRIFKVKDFRKQYDKIVSAAQKRDIEGVKAAQPMVNASSFDKMPVNMRTKDFQDMGLNMPPYHFHCRTTHVAYFENEKGSVYSANKNGVWGDKIKSDKETKGFLTSYSDKELFALINQKKDWAKNDLIEYNPKDFDQDIRDHSKEIGIDQTLSDEMKKAEMKRMCNETVRNATNVCINRWIEKKTGEVTLQSSYYDGKRIVVVDDNGKFRCVIRGNDKNWLKWKKIDGRLLRGK